ncbi:MAG: NUDIX domain-containing protein [Alphaproteobacteria bacterium]|nr:NUDIX domain-containing protein [Alphaproteobacteria bacterium]
MYDKNEVHVLARETVFQGHFKIDRLRLRHRLYEGGMGAEIVREVFDRGHAVAVLPYDPTRDEVVLVEQFRIGPYVGDDPPWQLEIVAGLVEDAKDPVAVVHREAAEEAGLELGELVPIVDYYSSPGATTERIGVYCARVDTDGVGGVHGLPEEGEDIRVVVMSCDEAQAALAEGRILASPAIIALQWLALNREALRRRWQT